jgi:hypothetical protein
MSRKYRTQDLHGATSQKTAFFIVTAVKASNLTKCRTGSTVDSSSLLWWRNSDTTGPVLQSDVGVPSHESCWFFRLHCDPSTILDSLQFLFYIQLWTNIFLHHRWHKNTWLQFCALGHEHLNRMLENVPGTVSSPICRINVVNIISHI